MEIAALAYFVVTILFWLAITAAVFWIGYLIIRTAVKNGVIRALQKTGRTLTPPKS